MKKSPTASVVMAVTMAIGLSLALTWAGVANADPLIVGVNASGGSPAPITTYDFAGGAVVGSFIPDGAHGGNGRALAIAGNEIFYTEIGSGIDTPIHVCPFNGGAGGADTRILPNPRPGVGVQDLAFYGGFLYALSGYPIGGPVDNAMVLKLNPTTGAVQSFVPLSTSLSSTCDGFVVLPNGDFLINDADTSTTYREYDGHTGQPTGFSLVVPGAGRSTGVEVCSDGQSLYFATDFNSFTETDLAGNLLAKTFVAGEQVEDIALIRGYGCSPSNACVQIQCPADIVVVSTANVCTNELVNFTVTATDLCGHGVNIVSTPPSGSFFAVGTTNVHCVATDTVTSDSASCDFLVTVVNTNCYTNGCLQILCPPNITVTATNSLCTNAEVDYTVSTVDLCQNSVNLVCSPRSGYSFAVGTTSVHCTAIDADTKDSASCDFTVTVTNNNCPSNNCLQMVCPTNIVVVGCTNMPVTYLVTVIDPCGSNTLVCTPPSGYAFPIGTTNVHCVATDVVNNQSMSCDFPVTVVYSNCVESSAATSHNTDFTLEWRMMLGHTAFVQRAVVGPGGSFTNAFTDIGGPISIPIDPALFIPYNHYVLTNFTDPGVLTNPARYYRVRFVP